jgi:glycerol-3-phosphate acyltransferase PlsY
MTAILSLGLGYLVGCINPAVLISRAKNINLKEEGTGNLGATNTAFVLGKKSGIFVLIFDVAKSFLSYKIAKWLFPKLLIAGILASIGCILGHCFPVFMHFEGGKGLAAFGGLILAYSPTMFLAIVTTGIILMFVCNTGVVAPFMGCLAFPVMVYYSSHDLLETVAVLTASCIIFATHLSNFKMAKRREDVVNTTDFVEKVFGKKK